MTNIFYILNINIYIADVLLFLFKKIAEDYFKFKKKF